MRVNDIRPTELRRLQEQAYAKDLERLRKRLPEFVHAACPACDKDSSQPAFEKYGFAFRRCQACRTIYMSPRPTPEIMAGYYGNSDNYRFWAEHIFPASEANRREKIHRPMLGYIVAACERHGVARRTLVEVGPGFGTFISLARESGSFASVIAIERTPEMAQACRDRGVPVIERAVEDVSPEEIGEADVLASFEVIEHLFDPGGYLRSAARLLRPGGLLVLTCPNGEGFDTAMLGALSGQVDSEHVNLFNPDSLAGLLQRSGFEVLEKETPGRLDAELVRDAVLAGKLDLSGNPFLKKVLLDEWERLGGPFQAFLAANGLSGHLRILASRR
jgi:SAM-dependent methyltransferase